MHNPPVLRYSFRFPVPGSRSLVSILGDLCIPHTLCLWIGSPAAELLSTGLLSATISDDPMEAGDYPNPL
jgi:hypothetical protein